MPHDHAERLARASRQAEVAGLDAIVVAPGPDLMYLTGYGPPPLERLTALVVRPGTDPVLLVPTLERPRAAASPAEDLVGFGTWSDGESMHAALGRLLPDRGTIGVIDQMWAWHLMELERELPAATIVSAARALSRLRIRKDAGELDLLARAGRAADEAFARVAQEDFAGRAEEQIAARLRELLVGEGCDAASFWIVASGPNGASPHHEPSARILRHLQNFIGDSKTTILVVGYQAVGTLGRKLLEGATEVFIENQKYPVKAKVQAINGFSAHADRDELCTWLGNFGRKPSTLFCTHGEAQVIDSFAKTIQDRFGLKPTGPALGDSVEI